MISTADWSMMICALRTVRNRSDSAMPNPTMSKIKARNGM